MQEYLLKRKQAIEASITAQSACDAKATVYELRRELKVVELALVGLSVAPITEQAFL